MDTSSVWRKCLSYIFIRFRKTIEKIKPVVRLFENSWADWWQKKNWFKIYLKKLLSIQFPLEFFQLILRICLKKFFCFFFQPQIDFCTQTKFFRKKKIFLHAKFKFLCAWRSPGYDSIGFCFSIHLKPFFFKNAEKSYFFRMACLCMPLSMSDNLKIKKT